MINSFNKNKKMEESSEVQPVLPTTRISFSDVVVSESPDNRNSLDETNSYQDYQKKKRTIQSNQCKRICCGISIFLIIILLFIFLLAVASRNVKG